MDDRMHCYNRSLDRNSIQKIQTRRLAVLDYMVPLSSQTWIALLRPLCRYFYGGLRYLT